MLDVEIPSAPPPPTGPIPDPWNQNRQGLGICMFHIAPDGLEWETDIY